MRTVVISGIRHNHTKGLVVFLDCNPNLIRGGVLLAVYIFINVWCNFLLKVTVRQSTIGIYQNRIECSCHTVLIGYTDFKLTGRTISGCHTDHTCTTLQSLFKQIEAKLTVIDVKFEVEVGVNVFIGAVEHIVYISCSYFVIVVRIKSNSSHLSKELSGFILDALNGWLDVCKINLYLPCIAG